MKWLLFIFCSWPLLTFASAYPERIISLAPSITENLFALGAGLQIAGVIDGSDYPAAAKKIPIVGRFPTLDLEKIIALRPDLIIIEAQYFQTALQPLQAMHIKIVEVDAQHLNDLPPLWERLGQLTGHVAAAAALKANFVTTVTALRQAATHSTPPAVFYQLGDFSLFTVNKNSWVTDIIDLCGGRNIFAKAVPLRTAFAVSMEDILLAQPDIILTDGALAQWSSLEKLSTRWQHRVYRVAPDLLERATPRLLAGAAAVCNIISQASKSVSFQ